MRLSLFVFSLLWAIPAFAADPKVEKTAKDEELVLGNWAVVSVRHEGRKLSKKETEEVRFVITKKRVSFGRSDDDPMAVEYTLDSKKKPKTIDITHELDPGKPIVHLGIYALKGNRLKLSLVGSGVARPKKFDEKTATTFVLERVKKPKEKAKP